MSKYEILNKTIRNNDEIKIEKIAYAINISVFLNSLMFIHLIKFERYFIGTRIKFRRIHTRPIFKKKIHIYDLGSYNQQRVNSSGNKINQSFFFFSIFCHVFLILFFTIFLSCFLYIFFCFLFHFVWPTCGCNQFERELGNVSRRSWVEKKKWHLPREKKNENSLATKKNN